MNFITSISHKLFILLAFTILLSACGGSETTVTENPAPPPTNETEGESYSGPGANSEDVTNFQVSFWSKVRNEARCSDCHVQGNTSPAFARKDDINLAYDAVTPLINRASPKASALVQKVAGGHNCWLNSDALCGDRLVTWIEDWVGVDESEVEIVLQAPEARSVEPNKNFPESPALFSENVHPILQNFCSECHQGSAAMPISPYIGSSDVAESYAASITKIDLDSPAESRLVARLRDEFHNCWSDDCAADAQTLTDAITSMADQIAITELDPNLLASLATSFPEGIVASGGGRFETHLIGKWEFKAGAGNVAYDSSGVSPALDLTLSGDYDWVRGWGIQLRGGKAQGPTATSRKIHDLIRETGEFSLEAWVAPANVTQEGPARIITYSGGDERRNFMLGQTLYNYDFFIRHDNTDANGEPRLSTRDADEDLQAALQHVVVNYTANGGRRIYVNGEFTDDTDNVEGASLAEWDDTFAFAIGSEVSGRFPFEGTVRMVAVHNRILSDEQIQGNFEAGIGERVYLMFGISELVDIADTFVVFETSLFDNYSYLFAEPFVVSLQEGADVSGISMQGVRIGINGREENTGQVFATLDAQSIEGTPNEFGGLPLSRQGTIIPIQQDPEFDEFFLTFDAINDANSIRQLSDLPPPSQPRDLNPQSRVGVRDFAEINASMATLTGVSTQNSGVLATYNQLRQQLPSVTGIGSFLTANQMAITQLAIKYCDALVEDTQLRTSYFPQMNFAHNANSGFDQATKDAIVIPLTERMLGGNVNTQPDVMAVSTEINRLIDRLGRCSSTNSCTTDTTETVVKASCAAVLGSAAVTLQ